MSDEIWQWGMMTDQKIKKEPERTFLPNFWPIYQRNAEKWHDQNWSLNFWIHSLFSLLLLNLFYSSLRIPEKNCFLMIVWSSFECFSPLDFPPKEEYISARRVLLYSILATSCTMDQWIITLYCMYKQHKNHFIQKYLKVTRWKQKQRK